MILRALLAIALAAGMPGAATLASPLRENQLWSILTATAQVERLASPAVTALRYYGVKGTSVRGYVNSSLADQARLRNGQPALIVPLLSGGSAGVTNALLYTTIAARRRFVGYIPSRSGHLQVSFKGGFLNVVTPAYGARDAQCCPSGRITETYTLRGIKLVRLSRSVRAPR